MDKQQLRQYKSTFHFGVSVKYDFILKRGYGEEDRQRIITSRMVIKKEWKQKLIPTRTGVVIGWRWLSNGIGNYDSDDGYWYTATQSIFAIEVKRAMMNRVDLVLPESLSLRSPFIFYCNDKMVIKYREIPDRIPTMSDKDKSWLSNEMKSVPRDSKGRWK